MARTTEKKKDVSRILYLADIAAKVIRVYAGEANVEYDDAQCDGLCLADDIDAEIRILTEQR